MPILRLLPRCKDYLWGGEKLRTDFGIQSDLNPLAEAWILSCHPSGPSLMENRGTLQQYIDAHPGCLGTNCGKFKQFPILVKLIDSKDNLSIQVHPSDEYALANEGESGKTEMWYVLDCEPRAYLYYDFFHEVSWEEILSRIQNNTLAEVLHAVSVHKGDNFFIPLVRFTPFAKGLWLRRFCRIPISPIGFMTMDA